LSYRLIPAGSVVRLKLGIRRGEHNDPSQGWTGGYATKASTGSIYLNVEYTVVDGVHAEKKIFSQIGLRSPKGTWWRRRGRIFIVKMLNSANGISSDDLSKNALKARRINGFEDIEGIEFLARIKVTKNQKGQLQNDIDEPIIVKIPDKDFELVKLNQKELTSKLTSMATSPIWMQL